MGIGGGELRSRGAPAGRVEACTTVGTTAAGGRPGRRATADDRGETGNAITLGDRLRPGFAARSAIAVTSDTAATPGKGGRPGSRNAAGADANAVGGGDEPRARTA